MYYGLTLLNSQHIHKKKILNLRQLEVIAKARSALETIAYTALEERWNYIHRENNRSLEKDNFFFLFFAHRRLGSFNP